MNRYHHCPVRLTLAADWVNEIHRHMDAPPGGLYATGLADGPALVGVAIVGRPTAPSWDDGTTVEVTRLAVLADARHACSMLYAAAWTAAKALGYSRIITYTAAGETGASVAAAGWVPTPLDADRSGDRTNRPGRMPGRRAAMRWCAQLAERPPAPYWVPLNVSSTTLFEVSA